MSDDSPDIMTGLTIMLCDKCKLFFNAKEHHYLSDQGIRICKECINKILKEAEQENVSNM